MNILDIAKLTPPGAEVANFQGSEHGANVSFFIVQFKPGHGPRKHRHPYEETFIILEGEIEAVINDETYQVGCDKIVVIPAEVWHEFKNCSEKSLLMVNLHPVPKMITEWA